MECLVCGMRSSVGSCVTCHTILCEVCGIKCEQCGNTSCPEHVHKTRSGHALCSECQEKRRASRRERHRAEDEDMEESASQRAREGEVALESEALVASARKPPDAWKVSLYTAGVGVIAMALLFLVPSLRRVPLPGGDYIPTPYILLLVPVFGALWAFWGLAKEENYSARIRCFYGLGVAVIACILAVVAVYTDPARLAEIDDMQAQRARLQMSPQELEKWHQERLQKFAPEAPPPKSSRPR